jgi:hypothetical protein
MKYAIYSIHENYEYLKNKSKNTIKIHLKIE